MRAENVTGVLALLFTIYLIPGLLNKNVSITFFTGDPKDHNLQLLSGFPPPLNYSIYTGSSGSLEADVINDYDKALQLSTTGTQADIDRFYGLGLRQLQEDGRRCLVKTGSG